MTRILSILSLFCLSLVFAACTSRSPILSQPGITQIGPSDWGLHNPIWSPDGKMVLATNSTNVHSWTSEIFVVDLSTEKIQSIVKTDYGNLEGLSWSPDGSQIAFSSVRGGDWPEAIWLVDIDGTKAKQYLVEGYNAAWSPDGDSIAILSTSLEDGNETRVISILNLKTKYKKVVSSLTGKYTTATDLAWSTDGKKLVFSFGKQNVDVSPRFPNVDIYVLDISTGETTIITNEGVNFGPKISPDGDLITFIRNTAGDLDFKIMISYKDGRCNQQIITKAYSADWSPDGKQLAFDYAGNLYTLDLVTILGKDFKKPGFLCSYSNNN